MHAGGTHRRFAVHSVTLCTNAAAIAQFDALSREETARRKSESFGLAPMRSLSNSSVRYLCRK